MAVFCAAHLTLVTPTTRAGWWLPWKSQQTGCRDWGRVGAVLHKPPCTASTGVIYCFYYGFTCYNGIMASARTAGCHSSPCVDCVVMKGARHTSRGGGEFIFISYKQIFLWSYGVIMEMILSVRQFTGYFILPLFMSEHCNKHYRADLLRPRWSPRQPWPLLGSFIIIWKL